MSAAVIYGLAPVNLNSTVLPTANLRVSPSVASLLHRNSGLEFASVEAVLGAAPKVSFSCPLYEAYALIGLKTLALTACDIYLAKFSSAIRQSGSVHPKYSLAASAGGFAYIRSISCRQGAIAMAEVEVVLTSSDGITHPLTAGTAALPSLAGQPALYTMGPFSINGTAIAGAQSASIDLAPNVEALVADGNLYPRVCAYKGADPVITTDVKDPETLRSTLGSFIGAAISANFVQYFRAVDPTAQTAQATGMSLTVASGRCIPTDIATDNGVIAGGGLRVECLSSSSTHPVVVATGAAVPNP